MKPALAYSLDILTHFDSRHHRVPEAYYETSAISGSSKQEEENTETIDFSCLPSVVG